MARMIDGDVVTERLRSLLESPHGENVYNSGYDDAIWHVLDVIEHMPTLTPPNEWVSVENALPPNMDDVLVVVQNNGECWTVTGYYSNTSNVWYAMLNGQDTKMDVLWWMPLPAPPTKEE